MSTLSSQTTARIGVPQVTRGDRTVADARPRTSPMCALERHGWWAESQNPHPARRAC
ncbi:MULTISPECIES: hypothetical protein [unclassified Haloferax]|uniref:hypothetical protein n=1 Tax=unclassified Haloferax TaxID=2625095 RepID=UPI001314B56D|nr:MULTISPECIES: hypothetical protein [unclassified Haloferax]